MSEGGYPAVGTGETSESPLPAGYGSLDAGFPAADPDALRRRQARGNGSGSPETLPPDGRSEPVAPVRPWARRGPRTPDARTPDSRTPAGRTPDAPPAPTDRWEREPRYQDADVVEGPVRGSRHPRQKVRVVRGVRSKRLVRRLDVWTVLKVSFIFYLLALIVLVVAGVIVWNVASAFGFIHTIEKSIRTLFSLKTFTLHPTATLEYGVAIGAVLCLVGVVVNVLAAVTYNLISDLVGGIQVVVVSETE